MAIQPDKYGSPWERDELIVALHAYCQIPFNKTKANNPQVIELSRLLARTPSSVARKLGNFGSFDPLLKQKGVSGLTHTSAADELVWEEFDGRWAELVDAAHLIAERMASASAHEIPSTVFVQPVGPSESPREVMVRRHQAFFRRAVLSSYGATCCFCGLNVPELVVGSHIIPWKQDESLRTDPHNGLCLCVLHDRAFDLGHVCVDEDLRVRLSSELSRRDDPPISTFFKAFDGQPMRKPVRFLPSVDCLAWHRENTFRS